VSSAKAEVVARNPVVMILGVSRFPIIFSPNDTPDGCL
jgi:hypothetical protein